MRGCDHVGRRRAPEGVEARAEAKVAATGEAIRWSVITIAL
jgi:hypothetical protein